MNIKLIHGDCLAKLKELEDNSVDSVVTDPPYEIGFMSKGWDNTGIAFTKDVWEECLRVLKPGGHLLAFSHSRTYHRMAVAVEDAGFEIRDQILWVYGSGFPKSHNIGKAVDKLEGNEREVVGKNPNHRENKQTDKTWEHQIHTADGTLTKGNSQYEGYGTALKPAHEPIVMARKPFKGSVAENYLEWGTGGINIDGCRIPYKSKEDEKSSIPGSLNSNQKNSIFGMGEGHQHNTDGRFPANIIFDEEAGKILDQQSGITYSGPTNHKKKYGGGTLGGGLGQRVYEANSGGASRFFYCPKASKADRNEGCEELDEKQTNEVASREKTLLIPDKNNGGKMRESPFIGAISGKRTNHHPTVKPTDLMAYLIRLVTPKGGIVLDPFMGSGSTGKAAVRENMSFIGIEREEEYMEIAAARIKHEQDKNILNKFI